MPCWRIEGTVKLGIAIQADQYIGSAGRVAMTGWASPGRGRLHERRVGLDVVREV